MYFWLSRQTEIMQPEDMPNFHPQCPWLWRDHEVCVQTPTWEDPENKFLSLALDEMLRTFAPPVSEDELVESLVLAIQQTLSIAMPFNKIKETFISWSAKYETSTDVFFTQALRTVIRWLQDFERDQQTVAGLFTRPEEGIKKQWQGNSSARSWLPKELLFMHFYSGRRREGDLQQCLEKQELPAGFIVTVISVDVAISASKCDLFEHRVQLRWLSLIKSEQIAGVGGGPPCESWSVARFRACDGLKRPPRPLRLRDQLWGLCDVTSRETDQLNTGNILMGFSLQATLLQGLTGGFAFLEHPADPTLTAGNPANAPSIWASEIVEWILQIPSFCLLHSMQGHFGGYSAKPTTLLLSGIPHEQAYKIEEASRTTRLPAGGSIGLKNGRWQTSRLKEYPEAFSAMIARQFGWWAQQNAHLFPRDSDVDLEWLRELDVELQAEPRIEEACPDYRGPQNAGN